MVGSPGLARQSSAFRWFACTRLAILLLASDALPPSPDVTTPQWWMIRPTHLLCSVCRCCCCYCAASACAWLPGWVPWCVAVGRVALAGSTILGPPMVCLQASCCSCSRFTCSAAVSGHDNATMVDDEAHLLCLSYACCGCCCFCRHKASWFGSLVRRCYCCCGFDPQTTRKRQSFSTIAFHRLLPPGLCR